MESQASRAKTPLQKRIILTKAENPTLKTTDVAKLTGTTRETVSRVLTRYGVDAGAVESYPQHRADIFDGLAQRIIASVTDGDIKAASLLQRLSGLGIIYDKMRIERGLSDSASKPMVQINIMSPSGQIVAQSSNPQVVEGKTLKYNKELEVDVL